MVVDISLIQGKKFKKYQNKIKHNIEKIEKTEKDIILNEYTTKEGFVNIFEKNKKIVNNNNKQDLTESTELNMLQNKFNVLLKEYLDLEQLSKGNTINILERYNNNTYNGNNLKITNNDKIGYVTNRGDFKWYGSNDDLLNTAGKNGCPVYNKDNIKSISISNYNDYNTKGKVLNTIPSLLVGNAMIKGQSCGNEGQNVYVNQLVPDNIEIEYKGCYVDKYNDPTMTFIGDAPATTGVLQNGNFQVPIISNNSYEYINSNQRVPGWNFQAVLINNSYAWGYPTPYPYGNQAACIQSTQNICQWIQLSTGTYNLSFFACGRYNSANTINIYLVKNTTDVSTQQAPVIYNFTPSTSQWTQHQTTFTISDNGLYELGFRGTITADKSSAIQNIQITQTTINSQPKYTYNMCKEEAINKGYKYFALQNTNSKGYGYCAVSNDEISATKYGSSKIASNSSVLWSSNTSGNLNCNAMLNNQGSISIVNASGASIFSTPATTKTPNQYIGCYADNPNRAMTLINDGKGLQKYNYDSCEKIALDGNYKYFALQNSSTGRKAACSVSNDLKQTKKYGTSNNCTTLLNGIVSGGGWSNAVYGVNASDNYFLLLDYDTSGQVSMKIYRGTSPTENQGLIWSATINGKAKDPNPNYVASKGKYGKNWISTGSTLSPGDFVGTTNGCAYLMMQTDGNLVLLTDSSTTNCSVYQNKNMGGVNANALYKLSKVGNPSSMGKIAFIDNDAILKEYPSSMVGKSTNYELIQNNDSVGNNLPNMPLTNSTVDNCKEACNNNNDCNGFVFDNSNKLCYLKNNNMFPVGNKTQSTGIDLYTRTPSLKNNSVCPSNLINIDSIQYDNYIKGTPMTPNDTCDTKIIKTEDIQKLNNISNKLLKLAEQIDGKINNLYEINKNINNEINTGSTNIKKQFKEYYNVKGKINNLLEIITSEKDKQNIQKLNNNNNNTIETMMNMNDLNSMISDTDLIVLQNNYQYVLWSMIAVGVVIITMNTIKK